MDSQYTEIILLIMLAVCACLMLSGTYYAQNTGAYSTYSTLMKAFSVCLAY